MCPRKTYTRLLCKTCQFHLPLAPPDGKFLRLSVRICAPGFKCDLRMVCCSSVCGYAVSSHSEAGHLLSRYSIPMLCGTGSSAEVERVHATVSGRERRGLQCSLQRSFQTQSVFSQSRRPHAASLQEPRVRAWQGGRGFRQESQETSSSWKTGGRRRRRKT